MNENCDNMLQLILPWKTCSMIADSRFLNKNVLCFQNQNNKIGIDFRIKNNRK